jgi:hypothetical protein
MRLVALRVNRERLAHTTTIYLRRLTQSPSPLRVTTPPHTVRQIHELGGDWRNTAEDRVDMWHHWFWQFSEIPATDEDSSSVQERCSIVSKRKLSRGSRGRTLAARAASFTLVE